MIDFRDTLTISIQVLTIITLVSAIYLIFKRWIGGVAKETQLERINTKLDKNLITEEKAQEILNELIIIKRELKWLNKKADRSIDIGVEAKTLADRALNLISKHIQKE